MRIICREHIAPPENCRTSDEWKQDNPVLALNEVAEELWGTYSLYKVGDGEHFYTELPYTSHERVLKSMVQARKRQK